tara:strand:- start:55 stop:267 length:213 start_codon:yes stop_codon:yes gene_type:complete
VQVGDLVKFVAPDVFKSAERDYPPSGIIIKVKQHRDSGWTDGKSYVVHWSNGKQTTEHPCYLKELSKNEQ